MRVLVTGGLGFIGSHVCESLLRSGHKVLILDNFSSGRIQNRIQGTHLLAGDVTCSDWFPALKAFNPEVIVHLAAQVSVSASTLDPRHDASVNIGGTVNVLEYARRNGVQRVVLASSAAVYGDPRTLPVSEDHPLKPQSPYAISKKAAEDYVRLLTQDKAFTHAILRFANVYGPRQICEGEAGVVARFVDLAVEELRTPFGVCGDGKQTRDFIYVADVAEAVAKSVEQTDNYTCNVSTQTQTSILSLVRKLNVLCGVERPVTFSSPRTGDIRDSALDNSLARKQLAWCPAVSLDEGLSKTLSWRTSSLTQEKKAVPA